MIMTTATTSNEPEGDIFTLHRLTQRSDNTLAIATAHVPQNNQPQTKMNMNTNTIKNRKPPSIYLHFHPLVSSEAVPSSHCPKASPANGKSTDLRNPERPPAFDSASRSVPPWN
jgi:hypothetical protein